MLPVAAATAWHSLHQLGSIRPDETVLIQGTGGISTTALQVARAGGARAIVVTRTDRHVDALKALGADAVLANGATPGWPDDVIRLTEGIGADVSINVAAGATLTQSIIATKLGGVVHQVGYASGTTAELDIFAAIRQAATIRVATAGNRESFEAYVRAAERHRIRPAVAKVFELANIRDAFDHLAEGGHLGKVALKVNF